MLEDSDNQIGELLTCPACNKDVRIVHPNEFSSCLCTNCYTVWYPDCNHEPHWPMSCEQFAEWSDKWEMSCRISFAESTASAAELQSVEISLNEPNPSTLKVETKKYYSPFPAPYREYHKSIHENYQKFEVEYYGQSIDENLQVKAIAMLLRVHVFVLSDSFAKTNPKLRSSAKETEALLGIFPDVRRTILCLVEYGLAWIYINKKANTLKTPLLQLFMQLDELTNDVLEEKSNLDSCVSTLDSALSKMVDQIKKAL